MCALNSTIRVQGNGRREPQADEAAGLHHRHGLPATSLGLRVTPRHVVAACARKSGPAAASPDPSPAFLAIAPQRLSGQHEASPSAGRIHSTAGEQHPGGSDSSGDAGFTAVQPDLPAANSAGSHVSSHGPRPPLLCTGPGPPRDPLRAAGGTGPRPCTSSVSTAHLPGDSLWTKDPERPSLGPVLPTRRETLHWNIRPGEGTPGGSLGQLPGQRLSTGTDFSPQGRWGSFWGHF